jgi:membrane-anchored protein YejM (alkaline phosphatase superfamily)
MTAKRKARNWHLWPIAVGLTIGLALVDALGIVSVPWYIVFAPLAVVALLALVALAVFGFCVLAAIAAKDKR